MSYYVNDVNCKFTSSKFTNKKRCILYKISTNHKVLFKVEQNIYLSGNPVDNITKITYLTQFIIDDENMTLEEKCEHLMNIVVESRKRFGKMCTEYEQKTSLVENKMLNLQIETITNYRFKSKVQLPQQDTEDILKELEQFADEIQHKQRRMEKLDRDVKNTQNIVLQLKGDRIGEKLKAPLTTEEMLSSARNKIK